MPPPENAPTADVRATRAEIDLTAIRDNLAVIRARVAPSRVYGVVKADAYGHGLVPVARTLARAGVDALAVALVEEGLALRSAGIEGPVLVLNGVYGRAHADVLAAGLTPVVYDPADVEAFAAAAPEGERVTLHLKVDTGMSRLGVGRGALGGLLDAVERRPGVQVSGLMTHLSSAERPGSEATEAQLGAFGAARATLRARGHAEVEHHAANSGGVFGVPEAHFDAVRAGISLYGAGPGALVQGPDGEPAVRPAMRLVAEIARVFEVPAGTPVGYGETFRTARPSRLATLAIGYGDGLPRALSSRGEVLLGGARCPIVGRVSMDLTTVDVTDAPPVARGQLATLIGEDGGERITAADVAGWADTIDYEILTRLGPRVPRVYSGA